MYFTMPTVTTGVVLPSSLSLSSSPFRLLGVSWLLIEIVPRTPGTDRAGSLQGPEVEAFLNVTEGVQLVPEALVNILRPLCFSTWHWVLAEALHVHTYLDIYIYIYIYIWRCVHTNHIYIYIYTYIYIYIYIQPAPGILTVKQRFLYKATTHKQHQNNGDVDLSKRSPPETGCFLT